MSEKRGWAARDRMLSGEPVMKLSAHTTVQPCSRRNSQRCEPMKPAPPGMRTRMRGRAAGALGAQDGPTADGVVLEAEATHPLRFPHVPAVEDHGPAHDAAQPLEVQELELVPLRHQGHA